ncbi:MAG: penicillin-binding protein 2, partial [Gammaproteobacteria bacterium]|nr:penicillin-binding protein 2 [Gammaproteobacteria bacterium]
SKLYKDLIKNKKRSFVYLKRRIDPQLKEQIKALEISGIFIEQEYRRYYPAAQITSHVVGFTNIDGKGLEGIELIYDEVLTGKPGHKRVIRNRLGQIITIDENQLQPEPGKDLYLSLDKRIQYLAYTELKQAIKKHNAKSGSLVALDITTGEVLALVNQPGFNPNNISDRKARKYKNRAMTDQFEPGSTMKPFTIMAALQSKRYAPSTMIDTGDGWYMLGHRTIKDTHAYGKIDVSTVLQKSSNVGTAKIAQNLPDELLWDTFSSFGFGEDTGSLFYGETLGKLNKPYRISNIAKATISYGYGMTASAVQLAQAYSTIARQGEKLPVNLLRLDEGPLKLGQTNISSKNIKRVIKMMETVVDTGGTAPNANIPGYRVAGKTGTAKKASKSGGYTEKSYTASFVGFAPVSNPKIVVAVVVDDPKENGFYGGVVAGPVFKKVMSGALRLLNISPDSVKHKTGVEGIPEQINLKLAQKALALH